MKRKKNERSKKQKANWWWYNADELSTLPFGKHTPPRAPICKNETAPRAFLADLDDRLPRRRQTSVRLFDSSGAVLLFARETDDLLTWALDRQLSGLLLRGRHGRSRVGSV